ncbi:MAG: hypothetical protein KF878_14700 [Planctomycetes bacterium]|nr:hypothetical protein [Planctomycetota bacterium]
MRARGVLISAALGLLLAAGPAGADVVQLTTGRTISGTIVSEDDEQVVIKTPDGRVTLPRRLVKAITRQGRGETLLAMARERATAGAHEEAERLYEQAAADPDPAVARRAREEQAAVRARREQARAHTPAPSTPLPMPDEAQGQPVEGQTLQDDLDRARHALEKGDAARARRLLENLVAASPQSPTLRYLLGRACELSRADGPAREAYQAVLGPDFRRDARPTAWLGELARRAAAGEALTADSPGVGPAWRRAESPRFAIYHPFERVEPWFTEEPEAALRDVLERLKVQERELRLSGRVQVVIYGTADDYQRAEAMTLAGGHAQELAAPDGRLKMIRTYPDRTLYRRTYRHEVAHLVLHDVAPGLPGWASEGAATFTEPLRSRAWLRHAVVGRQQAGQLPDLMTFLRGEVARGGTVEDVRAYYGQAVVTFEALVQLCEDSPRKALTVCRRIGREGPERGLLSAGLSRTELQRAFDRVAADRSAPPADD